MRLRALRSVKGGDLDGVAFACVHLREKAYRLGWASSGRADGGDEMEKMHAGGCAWSMIRAGYGAGYWVAFFVRGIDIRGGLCATLRNSMDSNVTDSHDPAELGELERAIMQLVWQHGTLTAEQVREGLERPLKDSTIRTVLRRLEEKGYVTHTTDNRTFLYSPAEPRQMVAGRAVKRIVDWFCDGSVEALLVGMVDSAVLDGKELQRLADRIATAKKGKK
jgi:BlaI family penicillinase repressor